MLEALLGPLGNNFGILNEQIDPATGMALGTFPQGLNHLALLHATFSIRRTPGAVGTLEFYSNLQIVFAGTTCRTTVALTLLASSGKSGPNPTAPGGSGSIHQRKAEPANSWNGGFHEVLRLCNPQPEIACTTYAKTDTMLQKQNVNCKVEIVQTLISSSGCSGSQYR
jgi:hypothetical protein